MNDYDFQYRTIYTWDHSTNWDLSKDVTRIMGCHEIYDKPAEAFFEDYRRLIDYMHQLGLNHLIIWGALRDSHGGVAELRRLIKYGLSRGVKVAPGVGVNAYGGIYYEGDHEFSLEAMLTKHPELAAVNPDGRPMPQGRGPRKGIACPRNPIVADWTRRGVRWLMQEVNPPAIHFEQGDYGLCRCEHCLAITDLASRTTNDDLADILPPLVAEVRGFGSETLLSYNFYQGYTREMSQNPPRFAREIPADVVCKYGVSWMLAPEFAPTGGGMWTKTPVEPLTSDMRPPTAISMAHFHFGTGWWKCSPRGTLEITRIMQAMPLLKQTGFQGVCTHAEESALNPSAELNYQVYAALARRASATPKDIAERGLGRLYGDTQLIADVLEAYRSQSVHAGLTSAAARAAIKARGQIKVRWNWLTFELHRLAEKCYR